MTKAEPKRCRWAGDDPLMIAYHDTEWGVPVHDDRRLFEMLTLEGAQAGLSWSTILHKRAGYRRAFARFDPKRVSRFDTTDVARLVADASIVRHRGKIESTIANAHRVLEVQREFGSLSEFLWGIAGGEPIRNRWRSHGMVPARTELSDAMSKALKKRGFSFVGSTVCYAFMQACGFVDDHTTSCFRHGRCG